MAYAEELLGYLDKAWGEGHLLDHNPDERWVAMVYGLKGGVYADDSEVPGIWIQPLDERGKIPRSGARVEILIKDSGKLVYRVHVKYKVVSAGHLNIHFTGDLETDAAAVMEHFETLTEVAAGRDELVPAGDHGGGGGEGDDGAAPEPEAPEAKKTWRDAKTDEEVIKLFPSRPKYDELLDLHTMAKERRSNKLANLVKAKSQYAESVKGVIRNLLA